MTYGENEAVQLLAFIWKNRLYEEKSLILNDGREVTVVSPGRMNLMSGPEFTEAELLIDGEVCTGDVSVHGRSSDWGYRKHHYDSNYDRVIMNVVAQDDRLIQRVDRSIIPCLELQFPEKYRDQHRAMVTAIPRFGCGSYMARSLSSIELKMICERLLVEREKRKFNDIMELHRSVDGNWNETAHLLLARTIGLNRNTDFFIRLARTVTHKIVSREREDREALEAMLFGVAGYLGTEFIDRYHEKLRLRFEKLQEKYDLPVIGSGGGGMYFPATPPEKHPARRIAQLASILQSPDFRFDRLLDLDSLDSIYRIFNVPVNDYWRKKYDFGKPGPSLKERVGEISIDLIITNFVVQILFAYGMHAANDDHKEKALEYLSGIKPEINRFTKGWQMKGVKIDHAAHSQALIQLTTEYCAMKRCCTCPIGVKILKSLTS